MVEIPLIFKLNLEFDFKIQLEIFLLKFSIFILKFLIFPFFFSFFSFDLMKQNDLENQQHQNVAHSSGQQHFNDRDGVNNATSTVSFLYFFSHLSIFSIKCF